jgi:hypothetical protein
MSEQQDGKLSAHEEQWLDRMLEAAPRIEPSATLRRQVAEIPLRHPQAARAAEHWLPRFVLGWAFAGVVLTVMAGAGVWTGLEQSVLPEIAMFTEEPSEALEDDPWQELSLLAFADDLDKELLP